MASASDLRDIVIRRRDAMRLTLRERERELSEIAAARSAESSDDEHDPEGTTLAESWSRAEALREDAEKELRAIDVTLARLDAGTVGICEDCGDEIPVARLEALPTATRCVHCAARAARRR